MATKKTYIAKVFLKMGTVKKPIEVKPGEELDLTDSEAEGLLANGAVELSTGPRVVAVVAPAVIKPSGQALMDAISKAVLDLDQDEDFTADGKPSVNALSGLLGYAVTAKERDAWDAASSAHGSDGGDNVPD
ncbi:hypothetical protein [Kiloniella laminariae]|uniref:hypothetical protein n=1 Tax=Kiloniella laminariae TaxID=454162 RepID=UPI00036FCF25|nr:hypothetical protein [Kiloniella laminariae]